MGVEGINATHDPGCVIGRPRGGRRALIASRETALTRGGLYGTHSRIFSSHEEPVVNTIPGVYENQGRRRDSNVLRIAVALVFAGASPLAFAQAACTGVFTQTVAGTGS